MRIISFDVGIKNMAYCLFEVGCDNSLAMAKTIKILQWNVLNLSGAGAAAAAAASEIHTCSCVVGIAKKLPNGKPCGKKAKYGAPPGSTSTTCQYYCQKHAEAHATWCLPTKDTKLTEIKKKKVDELVALWKEVQPKNMFSPGVGSCSLKKGELIEYLANYYKNKEFSVLPVSKKVKAGEINLIEIGQNIRTQLDHYLGKMQIDHVLIENQISTIATRMKTIQGMLAQYFIMRENGGATPKIEFISSHNKLKGFSLEHVVENDESGDKKKYKANKMNGVDVCRRFLDVSVNPTLAVWKEEFERNGKKDDLADGFLQGIFYLKREKIINYAENLNINIV